MNEQSADSWQASIDWHRFGLTHIKTGNEARGKNYYSSK